MTTWKKISRLQLYTFLASMPVISFLLNYVMYGEAIFNQVNTWLISFPLIFLMGMGSWRGHVLIANWIRYRYPALQHTKTRILILAFCLVPFMSFSVCVIFYVYDYFSILGYSLEEEDLKMGLLIGFCVNIIFETLYEADYVLQQYKQSVEEKKNMEQLSILTEFDVLKNQVNPHFLFNCFNTLSSLITVDKHKAEQFLNELSKVYRYLLRNNEDSVSSVENEIRFIRSYYGLLQTRHGEAVRLNIEIDKKYEPYLLPSLTLQLLVENVVKHNVLSKNIPLTIDIFTTEGNKLVVNNNLQRRTAKAPSNKVGLGNIKAKYELLKQPGFQVMEDEKNFTVVLPLIWNNTAGARQLFDVEIKTS